MINPRLVVLVNGLGAVRGKKSLCIEGYYRVGNHHSFATVFGRLMLILARSGEMEYQTFGVTVVNTPVCRRQNGLLSLASDSTQVFSLSSPPTIRPMPVLTMIRLRRLC